MSEHRIRLTDEDIALIVGSLRARHAMTTGLRSHRVARLIGRLTQGTPGNPKWILSDYEQTHEDVIDSWGHQADAEYGNQS